MEPHFKPGGRFEKWYALYEAVDTIFYSPSSVTRANAHVRDGVDLKRIMITVWFATFPAIFYGMYNIGFQANDVLALSGGSLDGWRGGVVAALGGHDANNGWHNLLYGLVHFLPLYLVTFVAGGFWEVLFAMRRGHEVNEGFFRYLNSIHAHPASGSALMAGGNGYQFRCCDWQGSFRRHR
jgi:Na+-transporting NADH:ubiquinone oxidoreductase subunit B